MLYGEKKRFSVSIVIITFLLFYILYNKTYSTKSLIEKLIFTSWCFQMLRSNHVFSNYPKLILDRASLP